ncbi:MAG: hypothetical protein ABIR38_02295 [Chthoniobacterales bacterium]
MRLVDRKKASAGGFLGIGDKLTLVNWKSIEVKKQDDKQVYDYYAVSPITGLVSNNSLNDECV